MTTYLYPQNLKATANLWLWSLRDFANYGHSTFVIDTDTCTDENNSTSCSNSLFRLFVNKTGRYNNS